MKWNVGRLRPPVETQVVREQGLINMSLTELSVRIQEPALIMPHGWSAISANSLELSERLMAPQCHAHEAFQFA